MPSVEQLTAMPTTLGSVIWARANGQHDPHAWELGGDGKWYRFNDRRSSRDLNLVEVLRVAPDHDLDEVAA